MTTFQILFSLACCYIASRLWMDKDCEVAADPKPEQNWRTA